MKWIVVVLIILGYPALYLLGWNIGNSAGANALATKCLSVNQKAENYSEEDIHTLIKEVGVLDLPSQKLLLGVIRNDHIINRLYQSLKKDGHEGYAAGLLVDKVRIDMGKADPWSGCFSPATGSALNLLYEQEMEWMLDEQEVSAALEAMSTQAALSPFIYLTFATHHRDKIRNILSDSQLSLLSSCSLLIRDYAGAIQWAEYGLEKWSRNRHTGVESREDERTRHLLRLNQKAAEILQREIGPMITDVTSTENAQRFQ